METIYPSLSAQVAVGTIFMKSQVYELFPQVEGVYDESLILRWSLRFSLNCVIGITMQLFCLLLFHDPPRLYL